MCFDREIAIQTLEDASSAIEVGMADKYLECKVVGEAMNWHRGQREQFI